MKNMDGFQTPPAALALVNLLYFDSLLLVLVVGRFNWSHFFIGRDLVRPGFGPHRKTASHASGPGTSEGCRRRRKCAARAWRRHGIVGLSRPWRRHQATVDLLGLILGHGASLIYSVCRGMRRARSALVDGEGDPPTVTGFIHHTPLCRVSLVASPVRALPKTVTYFEVKLTIKC